MIEINYFDKQIKKGKVEDISKLKNFKKWIDVTDITKEEEDILRKEFKLHPLTSEDLFNKASRVKVEEFPNYLFSIFYGVEKNKEIDLVELDFVLGKNFLITNHKSKINSFEEIKKDAVRLKKLFTSGMDFLFHRLLDKEVDNFLPVLESIDDKIEDIEEKITKNPNPELLTDILKLKKRIVKLKKITFPQREKISYLAKNNYRLISNKSLPYFRDIYDHAIRVSDTIDNYRENVGTAFDIYMSAVSNNMNKVMKAMSIIATTVLPLGIISGIYGTNFDILPGQHTPGGFWIMIGGMLVFISAMMYYFKKKKWF